MALRTKILIETLVFRAVSRGWRKCDLWRESIKIAVTFVFLFGFLVVDKHAEAIAVRTEYHARRARAKIGDVPSCVKNFCKIPK